MTPQSHTHYTVILYFNARQIEHTNISGIYVRTRLHALQYIVMHPFIQWAYEIAFCTSILRKTTLPFSIPSPAKSHANQPFSPSISPPHFTPDTNRGFTHLSRLSCQPALAAETSLRLASSSTSKIIKQHNGESRLASPLLWSISKQHLGATDLLRSTIFFFFIIIFLGNLGKQLRKQQQRKRH